MIGRDLLSLRGEIAMNESVKERLSSKTMILMVTILLVFALIVESVGRSTDDSWKKLLVEILPFTVVVAVMVTIMIFLSSVFKTVR